MEQQSSEAPKRNSLRLWLIILVATATLLGLAGLYFVRVDEMLSALRGWIGSMGPWAPVVYVAVFVVITVLLVPASTIGLMAGPLFGSFVGVICVSIASTLAAIISFLIARYFATHALYRRLEKVQSFRRLDDLTRRHGGMMVAIVRLIPHFPFAVANYGFGLTHVSFWRFALWSWLCMLPAQTVSTVASEAVVLAIERKRFPWLLMGLEVLFVAVLVLAALTARRWLQRREAKHAAGKGGG